MPEKLIKSKERVKKFAEVFTPQWVVKKMCDLLEQENVGEDCFEIHKTFIEPCCGTGNFIVEIIERKLKRHCKSLDDVREAVASVYGVDIQADNVAECRNRTEALVKSYFPEADVRDILERNIVVGDFLHPKGIWFLEEYEEQFAEIVDGKKRKKTPEGQMSLF